jgi:hypothetical protein
MPEKEPSNGTTQYRRKRTSVMWRNPGKGMKFLVRAKRAERN